MKKINYDSNGFSVIELLLVIVTLAIIGTAGYFVAKHVDVKKTATAVPVVTSSSNKTTKTSAPVKAASTLPTGEISTTDITGSYSYPGGYYSVMYPANWDSEATSVPTAAAQPGILPTVVTITPPNAAQGETTGITVYKSTSLSNALTYAFVDNGTTVENTKTLTINGYNAMYQQNVLSGAGGSTEDSYAVTNGTYTVVLSFKVTQMSTGVGAFDATSLLPQFNAIVSSIKF